MLELGTKIGNVGLEIPSDMLTTSVPEKFYHLRIQYSGTMSDEVEFAKKFSSELYTMFKAKVAYMRIAPDYVDVQLEGSPFAWAALVLWLPTIFVLFGLTLIGVGVFTVLSAIPSWAWGVVAVGVLLVVIAPTVGKLKKR